MSAAAAVKVDGSAVTQPISGTVDISNNFALDATLGTTNTKLDTIDTSIGNTNTKLDTIDTDLGTINTSIGTTNTKLDAIDTSIETINTTLTNGSQISVVKGGAKGSTTGAHQGEPPEYFAKNQDPQLAMTPSARMASRARALKLRGQTKRANKIRAVMNRPNM